MAEVTKLSRRQALLAAVLGAATLSLPLRRLALPRPPEGLTIRWDEATRHSVLLTSDRRLVFATPPGEGSYLLRLTQDTVGGRTVTWPKNIKWVGGRAPALSTKPGAIDLVSLYYDRKDYFASYGLSFC
jgi:hypothetical protein